MRPGTHCTRPPRCWSASRSPGPRCWPPTSPPSSSTPAGPLYWIGRHYQAAREFHTAQLFFARGLRVPEPRRDRLFVDRAIHDYLLRLEYAVTCYYTGDHAEAIAVNDHLLRAGKLPEG